MAPQKNSHLAILLAQQAVHMTRARFATELDFSEESLQQVDALLDLFRGLLPPRWLASHLQQSAESEDLYKFSLLWGNYVGEVIRRNFGGQWLPTPQRELRLDTFILCLPINGEATYIQPALQVHRRLVDKRNPSIYTFYQQLQNRWGNT